MPTIDDESVLQEAAAIKREAAARTGLGDCGDPAFERPLLAWVQDLRNPGINDLGRAFLRRLAVRDLRRHLEVLAYLAAHPEILEVEIPRSFSSRTPRALTDGLDNAPFCPR